MLVDKYKNNDNNRSIGSLKSNIICVNRFFKNNSTVMCACYLLSCRCSFQFQSGVVKVYRS